MKTLWIVAGAVLAAALGWLVYQQSYAVRMLRHLQYCLRDDYHRYDLSYETQAHMDRDHRRIRKAQAAKEAATA